MFLLPEFLFILLLPLLVVVIYLWLWIIRIYPFREDCQSKGKGDIGRLSCDAVPLVKSCLRLFLVCGLMSFLWIVLLKYFDVPFFWMDLYFLGIVITLILFDAKYWILPDPAVYLLLWGGIFFAWLSMSLQLLEGAVIGVIAIYVVMLLVYGVGWVCYRREVVGRGDLKFAAAIGAWIGAGNIFCFLLIASSIGIVSGIFFFFRVSKNWKSVIPFGPSLGFSGIILYFMARFVDTL